MATRNIVPRSNGEGGIGTSNKKWLAGWFVTLTASTLVAEVLSDGAETVDVADVIAAVAASVTNGDSHDHSGGDGAQIDHTTLSNIGTNAHSAIDTFISSKNQASGLAPLGADSKVPVANLPDAMLGALIWQGTWNAATNSPAIPAAAAGNKGNYYKVSVAGTTAIDGIAEWAAGDWIVSNGAAWEKVDNSEIISSVNGQTNVVVLDAGDVGAIPVASATTVPVAAGVPVADANGMLDYFYTHRMEFILADADTTPAQGDGKAWHRVDAFEAGMNLVGAAAHNPTAGTGATTIQLRRDRNGTMVDMLSTLITIDSTERDSKDAAACVVDLANDDLLEGDLIWVDLDAIGTGAKGTIVQAFARKPLP